MLTATDIHWHPQGKKVLQGINFHLNKSEVVGLVGPNGSGKSSLLKILSFLETPTSGVVSFQGQPFTGKVPLEIRRRIAVVFQEPLLLNDSVYENVASGLKIRRVPKHEIKDRVEHWLDQFGIVHLRKQHARVLSGGEAQRVSLARALVLEPDILFLDEPFSALDAPTRYSLLEDITLILQSTGTSTVFVSHEYKEILHMANRAIVLRNGEILAEDSPHQLLNKELIRNTLGVTQL